MAINNNIDHYEIAQKRQKLDDMVEGAIMKVTLKNFMTFSEIEYTPHSKLNMIIGPNGSGKSSIVTALILGFGGSPKDINRGDKISDFVKIGKFQAVISIELYKKSQSNIKLKRVIFTNNDSCNFYINDALTTKTKYIDVVESFNIRVHNLCQFLPQDRLEDFSKLDSKGLLLSTLQSIENQELLNNFIVLKDLATSISVCDTDLKRLQNKIKLETNANSKLETIVSSFNQKNNLELQLLTVLQKRSWCLYILFWKLIKDEIKTLDVGKKHNNDALALINNQKNVIKTIKSSEKDLLNVVLCNENILDKLIDKLSETLDSVDYCISNLRTLLKIDESSSIKIENYKLSILSMEEKLESIKNEKFNVEDCKKELNEINNNIMKIDDHINPLKIQLEEVKNKLKSQNAKIYAIQHEIEREKRKEEGKNNFLQRKYPEIWKAIYWLRNCNKSSIFVGRVFEPLFTQIEVLDEKNAKYIENIVNYRDVIAFVFEYAEDLTKFNKIIKQERWQKINSISAPPTDFFINEAPNIDISHLRQFGFYAYALDMIKVPPIIRRFLVKNYDMHNIPIGSNTVIEKILHLPSKIRVFFAGNDQVIIKTSLYTGEKIIRQTQISNDVQFLLFSVDFNLIQSLTSKMEEANAECENFEQQQSEFLKQMKVIEDNRQAFITRKKVIQGCFMKFQNKQNAYNKMVKDIDFTRSELVKEKEKTTNFSSQYMQLINKYYVSMIEVNKLLVNYVSSMKMFMASAIVFNNNGININDEKQVLKELKDMFVAKMNDFDKYLKYVQALKSKFKYVQEIALSWTRGVSPYDIQLFAPLKEKFSKIDQNDIDELDTLIIEIKAQLNCLNVDPKAPKLMKEYNDRKVKIKDLESKLTNLSNDVGKKEKKIELIHSNWFPKIQELCKELSNNFQKYLLSFGCNGIIELNIGCTRYDYHEFGISLKVQFRFDMPSLKQLDTKCQSGGERALSTALFFLALQKLTHFPFRIVDEINQGMDKVNERKLMELFMELVGDRSNQYFIVTPKLIKNLTYQNTTVDIIYCMEKDEE